MHGNTLIVFRRRKSNNQCIDTRKASLHDFRIIPLTSQPKKNSMSTSNSTSATAIDPSYHKANFPDIRPEWLARNNEQAIEADLPIVDAHHHLWELPGFTYMRDDLLADLRGGHNIVSTVYIDCMSRYRLDGPEEFRPVGETEFVVSETANLTKEGFAPCAGIVGWADLLLGDQVQPVLEQQIEAGQGRFRGVRTRAAWHEHPLLRPPSHSFAGMLLDPSLQRGVKKLGALGLSLDVWVYHPQLKDVGRLATACPDTTLVLDHCGAPLGIGPFAGRRDEVFRSWRDDIKALAAHSNIVVKLGGLAMPRCGFGFHEAEMPATSEMLATAWTPYLDTLIEAFGTKRCLFESNFPVDKAVCSYVVIWNAFKRYSRACSAAEREDLFSRTAATTYRLEHTLAPAQLARTV